MTALKASTDTSFLGDNPATTETTEDNWNVFTNCTTAADVASVLSSLGTAKDGAAAKAFAAIVGANLSTTVAGTSTESASPYTISVTGDGYYFIKDKADTVPTDTNTDGTQKVDSATRFMLEVVKDVTATAKSSTMQSEKKIDKDVNDSTGTTEENKDSADYDIGDIISYTITATLPSNYADYKEYYLKFTDTMSKGLTLNTDSVKIYYGAADTTGTGITFTSAASGDNTVYTYEIADLKTVTGASSLTGGSTVTIKYTATLNENAKTGVEGNPNTSTVTFNNDPNNSGAGKPTQNTPEDKVVAFTFEVNVDKIKTDNTALTGANFALYKLFKDDAALAAANASRASDKQYTKATSIKYDNGTKDYAIGSEVWALVQEITVEGSDFDFKGVDDGTYLLVETKTPDGYNSVQPMKFEITATHTDGAEPALSSVTGTDTHGSTTTLDPINLGTMTDNKGVETDVINNSGSVLPSTGGIGTTIFYILGSLLVLVAGVILVTKRRMGVEK
ncbi:MAG: isopeptide-forming domain-containing fimbrial protein [Clostridia bacterium]|nr:isopeptide-forming domain-containing fimbrial protein [Clostridia bacterium]